MRHLRPWLVAVLTMALLVVPLPMAPHIAAQESQDSQRTGREELGREELVGERTSTSKTYRNADGTLTTTLYSSPVHFREGGGWREISSDLVPSDRSEYEWKNEANSFASFFKDRLERDYLEFEAGGNRFAFTMQGAAAAAGSGPPDRDEPENFGPGHQNDQQGSGDAPPEQKPAASASPNEAGGSAEPSPDQQPTETPTPDDGGAPGATPSPTDAGSSEEEGTGSKAQERDRPSARVAYRGAFDGVDIVYDVVPEGVKETLVLQHRNVPKRYRFLLTPKTDQPVEVEQRPDGSWLFFVAPRAEPLFVLSPPFAVDAGQELSAHPDAVSLDVLSTPRGFLVELAVDTEWLRSPARQFPVKVDPTIVLQPPLEDASFAATCGNCTPYLSDRLYMGTDSSNAWRAALKFDLGAIPAGVTVSDARLKTFYDGYCISTGGPYCNNSGHTIDAHLMTKAWSTSSTSSALGWDPGVLASFTTTFGVEEWMQWNLTTTVNNWLTGAQANHGLLLKRSTEPLGASGPVPPGRRFAEASVRPKLEVTYVSDAVDLLEPSTLHSNGPQLQWTRYTGPSGASFQKYEVHRSKTPGFSPSTSTLLTTITDVNSTAYRDTTAAPNKAFTYKIMVNTSASNERTVTLPADGRASKVLQPDPAAGNATYIYYSTSMVNCANYGAEDRLFTGTSSNSVRRSLVKFDLSDIPVGATIDSAKLSLWNDYTSNTAMTVDAHRVTRAFAEGTGRTQCSRDGATWYTSDGTTAWSNLGGDFDAAAETSVVKQAGQGGMSDAFTLTGLAQKWVDGKSPNHGVLLKLRDETMSSDRYLTWNADDYSPSPSLRPKFEVSYIDGSHAQGPTVSVSSPAASSKVAGAVKLAAAASDDRRVDSVEFFVDGASKGTDTSAPFEVNWNTTSSDNGARNVTAKATDDAGNETTSGPVSFTVENSNPPSVGLSAPAASATVSGSNVTVSASASDDFGVERVEFFFDGNRIGQADTTSPYSVTWNTLDPAQAAYDGSHELTARAYDTHGQMTISAPRAVTVANAVGTKYLAGWSSTSVPQTMTYDPALSPQQTQPVDVTMTNKSSTTWSGSGLVLRYRWSLPDGTVVSTSGDIALGGDLRKGASRTLRANVIPPTLADGVDKAQYVLRVDLFEKSTSSYFGSKGNKPLDNPVIVNKALKATALGLERYYHYEGEALGAGMGHLTNVANGNSLLRWTPFSSPGRGLSTVLDLTYNSLEDRSESPVGNNFSLSISSLSRFGLPLDVHPNKADTIAGRSNKYIEFTDGDGTTHRFTQNANGGWDEPAGVHLYLREFSTTDATRKWALTRPDRVTFFYDDQGFPTSVEDRNGNKIEFTLQDVPSAEDPGGVKRRITRAQPQLQHRLLLERRSQEAPGARQDPNHHRSQRVRALLRLLRGRKPPEAHSERRNQRRWHPSVRP